jgi:DNA-directed RNA polymerase specialized sigma24 family protein
MYASTAEHQRRNEVQTIAEQLYRERYHYLLGIATKNAANRDDAEEAVQFSFAAFIEKFDSDSGSPPLGRLTLTVKRRCWASYHRARLDRSAGQEVDVESDRPGSCIADVPSEAAGVRETVEQVEWIVDARQRLAALKPAERRALGLIAAGFSYAEIGAMTGFSYTKTNRCAAEGRAALRNGVTG